MSNINNILQQHLVLNDKVFSFLEIKNNSIQLLDEYENEVLNFCHQWLNAQQEFILHTSGSTGVPKPITITRTQMEASASMTAKALGLVLGMRAFCCLNTSFVAGKMMLVRAMEVGMTIEVVKPSLIPFAGNTIGFDFIALVPMQVEAIMKSSYLSLLNKCQNIIIGGAPISYQLAEEIKKIIRGNTFHTYGMTETVSHIALKNIKTDNAYNVLDGVNISLSENDCLVINSILTGNEKLVTNDIVELISPNQFKWIGRADFVINSGGIKIHPALLENEIDEILHQKGIELSNFFVIGVPDETLGQKVVMYVEGEEVNLSEVFSELKPYHRPKKVFFVDRFEYTKTGKVYKKGTLRNVVM